MEEQHKYHENDTVIIGSLDIVPRDGLSYTLHPCHRCSKTVSVSAGTMDDALDHLSKNPERKFWIVCTECIKPEELIEGRMGDSQKEELIKAGIDVDNICRKTGKTITELTALAIERLQRAAKVKKKMQEISDGLVLTSGDPHELDPTANWTPRLLAIRATLELVAPSDPRGDWKSVAFIDGVMPAEMPGIKEEEIGKRGIIAVEINSNWMANDHTKTELAKLMRVAAVAMDARGITFINTIFTKYFKVDPEISEYLSSLPEDKMHEILEQQALKHIEEHGEISKHPEAVEKLMMLSIYYGGLDDGCKVAQATIKRSPDKPPQLTDWQLIEHGDFFGRFPDAITRGLKMAAAMRDSGESPA